MTKRQYTHLQPELKNTIIPLTEYGVVEITGKDAARFLQGQLSCHIDEVTDNTNQLGTANTPKGRVYSIFRIAKLHDRYLLRMPCSMTEIFKAQLSKYIVFFKAEINIINDWKVSGLFTRNSLTIFNNIPDGFGSNWHHHVASDEQILLPVTGKSDRYECWHKGNLTDVENNGTSSNTDWVWLDMLDGLPELSPEISDTFIPQMLNLDTFNALHFKKGCYTGQEIIARMRYLGKLKKRMSLFYTKLQENENAQINSEPAPTWTPGHWLLDKENKKVAQIVRGVNSANGHSLVQAVISVDASDQPLFNEDGIALSMLNT